MKKITIFLLIVLSVAAMAAQKPCGEVFSNVGIKTTLGIDGSRCVLSKVKENCVFFHLYKITFEISKRAKQSFSLYK